MSEEMVSFKVPRWWVEKLGARWRGSADGARSRQADHLKWKRYGTLVHNEINAQIAEWLADRPAQPDEDTEWNTPCKLVDDGQEVRFIGPDPDAPDEWAIVFDPYRGHAFSVEYHSLIIDKEHPNER